MFAILYQAKTKVDFRNGVWSKEISENQEKESSENQGKKKSSEKERGMWGRQSQDVVGGGRAALSTLYHHCIASSPENAKNLQHGTGQKTHCHDKEYVTNIQPCKLFKLRRCGKKKSFYINAKFCLVWSQNVFVNHLKNKDTGPFKLA